MMNKTRNISSIDVQHRQHGPVTGFTDDLNELLLELGNDYWRRGENYDLVQLVLSLGISPNLDTRRSIMRPSS